MKKVIFLNLAVLAILSVLLFSSPAVADTESGGFTYTILEDGTAGITGCSLTGDIVIPAGIDGYTVTNLAGRLFYGRRDVTSVSVPATVTFFGENAGDNKWDYVFSYCYNLKSITVDPDNPVFCSVDGVLYSKDKTTLINYPVAREEEAFHVPESVKDLCCTSFGCSSYGNLGRLYIDGENTWWYTYTFYGCGNLTVYYRPDGNTEEKVLSEIENGRSRESDSSRPVFQLYTSDAPAITGQPGSVTLKEGEKATFSVEAEGEGLTYQWYYQKPGETAWNKVSQNGTSATLTLVVAERHNGYSYRCTVTGENGVTADSNAIVLTVTAKPDTTEEPKNITVAAGSKVTFKVNPSEEDLKYQWFYLKPDTSDWIRVSSNGTSATLTLTAAERHNGYSYRCTVTRTNGTVNGGITTLTVGAKPTVATQPESVTVAAGSKATFKVAASGEDLEYQWYYLKPGDETWTRVSNKGTSAAYSLTTAARHNGYSYRCTVTNTFGSTNSGVATLTIAAKPSITTQPKSVTVAAGSKATFKVAASGTGLKYQWYYLKPGAGTWTRVSNNGTSSTYSLTTAARHNGYSYRCRVTNAAGYVDSGIATLTIDTESAGTDELQSITVKAGSKATFKVAASDADLSYQWYYRKPGTDTWTKVKNNGTSATYILTTASRHNGYLYRCKVSRATGDLYTDAVKLIVK